MTDSPDRPRGLWNVMKRAAPADSAPDEAPTPPDSEEQAEAAGSEGEEPTDEQKTTPRKGLWSVMGRSADVTEADTVEPAATEPAATKPPAAESPPPRGLWRVMGTGAAAPAPAAEPSAPPAEQDVGAEAVATPDVPTEEAFPLDDPGLLRNRLVVKTGRSRTALLACVVGLAALPLTLLALMPQAWLRFPATIAGFAALMLGLLGWQEVRSARGRQTGRELALAGIMLGVLAMFLGPIVLARVGQGHRRTSGRRLTVAHLEAVGGAVQSYHTAHGQFPPGGIFRVQADQDEQPMHGWLTLLLPHLGEEELYRSIQQDVPYDAAANLPAMRQYVGHFLAAGADDSPVGGQRMAPAHFAGVGGELNVADVGLVRAGVFGRNSSVTRDDVTDGLSQTLIAGEIAAFFPAWGEPENWRTIGRGINRDAAGFGNAADTGALFLKADGSVRFYANGTDVDVLQKLSTPNAGDVVPEQFR